MNFSDNFWEEYRKRKKKLDEQEVSSPFADGASDSKQDPNGGKIFNLMTGNLQAQVAREKAEDTAISMPEDNEKTWFEKSSAFDDGYQIGDVLKAATGTVNDFRADAISGVLSILEGTVDAGATVAGGVGKLFGADQFADDTKDFVKKDIIDEDTISKWIVRNTSGLYNMYHGTNSEELSVLGDKSDAIAQSAGQLLGTMGLQQIGVPWFLTSGVTSFGSQSEEAFKQDADYLQAVGSGVISAGAEILSEKLFGGSALGEKGLINVDLLTKGISNKLAKAFADFGVDVLSEGGEEVFSQLASNLGTALYREEKIEDILLNEEALEGYIDSFIGGVLLSGPTNAGKAVNSVKSGRDYRSGLTANEQAVLDKVLADRMNDSAADSKKISKTERAKILAEIRGDLEKGNISTDTIEALLGGDDYKAYTDARAREDAVVREFRELGALKDSEITVEQRERRNELREKLRDAESRAESSKIRARLDQRMSDITKDNYLSESYKQRAERRKLFEPDLNSIDERHRETYKRAAESRAINNSRRSYEFVELIAKLEADKGVKFDFTNNQKLKDAGLSVDGAAVNGYAEGNGIAINMQSSKALDTVVGHEISHLLEGTEHYTELAEAVKKYAQTKGEYDTRRAQIEKLYTGRDIDIDAELTADLVGDYIFSDPDFINRLSVENRNVFQKAWDWLKSAVQKAVPGSKEHKQLLAARRAFEKAYRENTKSPADGEVRYSLATTQNGDKFTVISKDSIDTLMSQEGDSLPAKVRTYFKKYRNTVLNLANDDKAYVRRESANEYTNPAKRVSDDVFDSKLKASSELENLFISSRFLRHANDDGRHPDAVRGWNYYQTTFAVPTADGYRIYSGEISVKLIARGDCFYDITKIKDITDGADGQAYLKAAISEGNVSNNSISQTEADVNRKNSLSAENAERGKYGRIYAEDIALPMPEDITDLDSPEQRLNKLKDDAFTRAAEFDELARQGKWGEATELMKELEAMGTEIETLEREISARRFAESDETVDEKVDGAVGENAGKSAENDTTPPADAEAEASEDTQNTRELLRREYERQRSEIEKDISDKDAFVKAKAKALYDEIRSLKKGVRASDDLGYILDFGHEWSKVKTALLNTMNRPESTVDVNSQAEALVRETVYRMYEDRATELADLEADYRERDLRLTDHPAKTADDRVAVRRAALGEELARNKELRESARQAYDERIAELQARYDSKKDKTTKTANDILRSIERQRRLRSSADAEYAKRIEDLEARIKKVDTPKYRRGLQRAVKQQEYRDQMQELIGDTTSWKDKNMGISYQVNTLHRNLRDVVRRPDGKRDIAKADAIYDELQGKYNTHEAQLKRESARIKEPYAKLKITKAEDAYIQMLGELQHNPDTELKQEDVLAFYEKHKKRIDEAKVNRIIEDARKTYDELIVRVNEVLREQGMKEIPYRKGYFPHFTDQKQGLIARLLNWKVRDDRIPTDIAGITEEFNPRRSWQSFNKERKGDTTDYSFTRGLDTYVHGALDWIYHIDDIQKRRAFENHIRYVHSNEGIKAKIKKLMNNEELDADELQEQIDLVYREAENPLNNFVTDLRTGTNALAGKKSSMDRGMESSTNRKVYSVMTNLSNRVSANSVAGSFSSALTNFIPITQSWGQVKPTSSLMAMGQTIRSAFRDDGVVQKSDFLTNRLQNEEKLYKTTWDKISDGAGALMDVIDGFTSQTVWRSKYLENISSGMSENDAIKNADQFAENVMAGRSRGNMPTIFDSKNPLVKTFTAFQLEVANQYGYMFKDMPQDLKGKGVGRLIRGYATMFFGAYAYNALYSTLTGRDAALDPIGIILDLCQDIFDDDEEEPVEIIKDYAGEVLEEVPFVGGLVGGGRIPISSALPYGEVGLDAFSEMLGDISDGNWKSLTEEWLKPIFYLALPLGGGQIRKTVQGLEMFLGDHPTAGSYTDSGKLRFPVEDTPANIVQAAIFGQWASKNAREYFDEGHDALTKDQTREFLLSGMTIERYRDYREGLKGLNSIEEKFDYIDSLNISDRTKNLLINNLVDRNEDIDMSDYGNYSGYEEFDYAMKNPEKYEFFEQIGVSYADYTESDEAKARYDWAYRNPEKFRLSQVICDDFEEYYQYKSYLAELGADKDEDGNSISGSKKKKVVAYINRLDLEYGQKLLLFKSIYPKDESYDDDILEYLADREDLGGDDLRSILFELGFDIDLD